MLKRPMMLTVMLVAVHCSLAGRAVAQWAPCGVPLSQAPSVQIGPRTSSDGAGGAFVVWRDSRSRATTDLDIYAQYVLADGRIASGWPAHGLAVCTDPTYQDHQQVIGDGVGGAYIAWIDWREYWTDGRRTDIFLQRLTASGNPAPGWAVNGNAVCIAPGDQYSPKLVLDESGGVIVVWEDHRRDAGDSYVQVDIYMQRMTGAGAIAPGWPVEGLAVCLAPGPKIAHNAISDGAGGVFIAWPDGRSSPLNGDMYAIRLDADGAIVPGWIADGTPVCTAPNHQGGSPKLVPDGAGGCVVAWADLRTAPASDPENDAYADVYAQRLTGAGTVAPGWTENGVALCTAPGLQQDLEMIPDDTGGAFVAWSDYRNYNASAADLYVQRVLGTAAIAPNWPVDGIRLSGAPGWQLQPAMAGDGTGGAWIAYSTSDGVDYDLYVQHLLSAGSLAPGWAPDTPVCEQPNGLRWYASAVSDGAGGMIVAWQDGPGYDIFAQHVIDSYPTPTLLTFLDAEVEPGRVVLRWDGGAPRSAEVERRTEAIDWLSLGAPQTTSNGLLSFEDRTVSAGRYAYRLSYKGRGRPARTRSRCRPSCASRWTEEVEAVVGAGTEPTLDVARRAIRRSSRRFT